ncbi:microtubule-associated protein 3-like, partial [Trifolium medium]|nr:microtubule-associated protein 3-like [Trifolium medium]
MIVPELEEMQKRKHDRRNQFIEVQEQIQSISNEIHCPREIIPFIVDDTDLSLRKLEELHRQLHTLQKEKTVSEVHPSLGNSEGSKSVNNDTISQLALAIQELRGVKLQRMQKLQDLATSMLELWNLMDTPIEEQQVFQNVTCNIAASEDEVTEPNALS